MFLGTYEHTIDAKGRLFIPAKLRDGYDAKEGPFIVTRGMELCLYVYASKAFQNLLVSKLSDLPVKNQQDGRAFKRLLLAGAQDVAPDEMGRILVPKPLIDFAGLKKEVAILGVGERIELWAADNWQAYARKAAPKFEQVGKQLEL